MILMVVVLLVQAQFSLTRTGGPSRDCPRNLAFLVLMRKPLMSVEMCREEHG